MNKIPFNKLDESDQEFIRTRIDRMFLYEIWVEEDAHIDKDSEQEISSGYYRVFAKMKPWANLLLVLLLPLLSLIGIIKVAVVTFINDMREIISPSKPFSVFSYRHGIEADENITS